MLGQLVYSGRGIVLLLAMTATLCASDAPKNLPTNLPIIKAKVGDPVLQELMGGCSLKCAFSWATFAVAPGQAPKPVYELDDDCAVTAWVDSHSGPGSILQFRMPKKLPAEERDTPFYGISIANGFIATLPEFKAHARAKKMLLSHNGQPLFHLLLADTWRWQNFTFPDIPLNQGDLLTLEIEEIYPGTESSHTAITEIVLQGAH